MNLFIFLAMATIATSAATLQVSSPAFSNNGVIPQKYACDGSNINPPINIKGAPAGTVSLALIIEDPDAPKGTVYHWVMWNITPGAAIGENSAPGTQGKNTKGNNAYMGPCPPDGTHHYHFKVYALDKKLDISTDAGKDQLEAAIKGHVLATGELVGLYSKKG